MVATVATIEMPVVVGSLRRVSLPSTIAIAPVTSRMPSSEAAIVASNAAPQPANPKGWPVPTTARKITIATDRRQRQLREVEDELLRPLPPGERERGGSAGELGEQQRSG